MPARQAIGLIFDIERFATKDGPGIRTVVFFKGCALRCFWCQNPESQRADVEVMYDAGKCGGCRRCLDRCPQKAIRVDPRFGLVTDASLCRGCGACLESCYYSARRLMGRRYSVEGLMAEIRKDRTFYAYSGGGVTFSGGEPLLQPAFLASLACACRQEGIHTALETCGHAPWRSLVAVLPHLSLIYYDFKHLDPEAHGRSTGVSNRRILENLRRLSGLFRSLVVRIPVVPGFNDSPEVQRRMFGFLVKLPSAVEVELLPFHRLGSAKYTGLGREYHMDSVQSLRREDLNAAVQMGREMGLSIRSGEV